jgi:hypothetical protein
MPRDDSSEFLGVLGDESRLLLQTLAELIQIHAAICSDTVLLCMAED